MSSSTSASVVPTDSSDSAPIRTSISAPSFVFPDSSSSSFSSTTSAADFAVTSPPPGINMAATPTVLSSPTLVSASPPYLIAPLMTPITIRQFPSHLPAPVESYFPSYQNLGDGSLVTPQFARDLVDSNVRLACLGALLMLFARNVFVSYDYLRRITRTNDKTLFWLLLCSQLFGPICFLALIVSWFSIQASCAAINLVSTIAIQCSYTVLITGILGLKAYRCLNRSRVALSLILGCQILSWVFFLLDLPQIESQRRLSGSCDATGDFRFMPIATFLIFLECLFICFCFLYAIWKSSRYPAGQGRISLLSLQPAPETTDAAPTGGEQRRGWWDYVPEPAGQSAAPGAMHGQAEPEEGKGLVDQLRYSLFGRLKPLPDAPANLQRKPSIPSEFPLPQPRRPFTRMSEKQPAHNPMPSIGLDSAFSVPMTTSPPPSQTRRRQKRKLPRTLLMRAVIKDELLHTTIITLSCVVATVFTAIGASNRKLIWGPSVWLGANWAIASLLVMRSYLQVVRRHEKEAVLQSPTAWDPMSRLDGPPVNPPVKRGRSVSVSPVPVAISTHRRPGWQSRGGDPFREDFEIALDPFKDFETSSNRQGGWDMHGGSSSIMSSWHGHEWADVESRRPSTVSIPLQPPLRMSMDSGVSGPSITGPAVQPANFEGRDLGIMGKHFPESPRLTPAFARSPIETGYGQGPYAY